MKYVKEKCSICGKIKRVGTRKDNKIICSYCLSGMKKEKCSICGKLKRVNKRVNKKPICSNCNHKNNKKECFVCKKLRSVASNEYGFPICSGCLAKKKKERCSKCGEIKIVARRIEGNPICINCNRKPDICYNCEKKRIGSRHNNKFYCNLCRKKLFAKKEKCIECGKLDFVVFRNSDKSPLCGNCRRKQIIEKCSQCGREKRVHSRNNGKPLCSACNLGLKTEYRFEQYKKRAEKKKLEFKINLKQFEDIISNSCYYCGEDKQIRGIDRKDSDKGYILENCVSSCWKCNKMKGKIKSDDFIQHIKKIGKIW